MATLQPFLNHQADRSEHGESFESSDPLRKVIRESRKSDRLLDIRFFLSDVSLAATVTADRIALGAITGDCHITDENHCRLTC
jgi:hypothetical protein